MKMIEEFKDWFYYGFLWGIYEGGLTLLKLLFYGGIVIITCPIWLIPFAYWYFREWRTNKESED